MNRIQAPTLGKRLPPPDDPLVQAAKAIHDQILDEVKALLGGLRDDVAAVRGELGGVRKELAERSRQADLAVDGVGQRGTKALASQEAELKRLRAALDSQEAAFRKALSEAREDAARAAANAARSQESWINKRLEALSGTKGNQLEALQKAFAMGSEALEGRLAEVQTSHEKHVADLNTLFETRLGDLHKAYSLQMDRMTDAIKALPTPTISVPAEALRVEVKQLPSQVSLSVPESAIKVLAEAPVQVHLPEPVVNVHVPPAEVKSIINVPPQEAPVVNVHAAPPRLVTKSFVYDEQGRPKTVVEKEQK